VRKVRFSMAAHTFTVSSSQTLIVDPDTHRSGKQRHKCQLKNEFKGHASFYGVYRPGLDAYPGIFYGKVVSRGCFCLILSLNSCQKEQA
jgi:hypothetical protein